MKKNSVLGGMILLVVPSLACILSPVEWETLPSATQPVSFSGMAFTPGATILLEARNQQTGAFEQFATAQASDVDILKKQPPLYFWSVDAPIATADDSSSWCRWDPECSLAGAYPKIATVRAWEVDPVSGSRQHWLFTNKPGWYNCIGEQFKNGVTDVTLAYWDCNKSLSYKLQLVASTFAPSVVHSDSSTGTTLRSP